MKIRMRQMVVGAALMGAAAAGSALAASAIDTGAGSSSTTPATDAPASTDTSTPIVIDLNNGSTTPAADTNQTPPPAPQGNIDPSKGGHQFNGVTEALLEGDTAAKVTSAAEGAVADGTVERVENDAEGNAPYEAHVVKSDGSHVTVYVNSDFSVSKVEADQGHGGPRGHHAPDNDGDGPQSQGTAGATNAASTNA